MLCVCVCCPLGLRSLPLLVLGWSHVIVCCLLRNMITTVVIIININLAEWSTTSTFGHMTTNLVECMNSVLKGAWALPITALVNETFYKINYPFVTNGMKIMNMIKAGHRYSEDVYVMMQENQHITTSHYVCMYVWEIGEFEVQEIANMWLDRWAMACTINLNEWLWWLWYS